MSTEMQYAWLKGPMNYNVASFPWEQVARPIYPLDEAMEWAAEAGSEGEARL
eukprot:COSAG04_NODE_8826_length_927_cov_0.981884_2_plen_52_part_00